jgi:hypothetical protein
MTLLQDRRVLIGAGAAAAIVVGGVIAFVLAPGRGAPPAKPTDAEAPRRLQVELGEQVRLDPNRQLRCFVGGQFVGPATLADCAKRNGVAAQALDVGIDESGALAARSLAPPPPPAAPSLPPSPALPTPAPVPAAAPTGECLRYGPEGWRSAGGSTSLSACVQALFAGRCQQPGQALYGRWGSQSLRLVPGRVETSPDNRDFRPLVDQARDCSIPPL